ncbi:MAG: hypothetical protein KAS15_00610 [Nanoarchaeota archaeon]|nr:hypothetical protein [Nanoarchaeota archaeon]
MIINNQKKAVIVLKAIGMPNLRLFPGYNQVDENGVERYFTNPAAKAHQKVNLAVVKSEALTAENKIQAKKAKEKNDHLNKAQRVIKAQNEKLEKGDRIITDQAETIKQLLADVKKLKAATTKNDKKN